MIVSEEKSKKIRELFHKYRNEGVGVERTYRKVAKQLGVGRTTVVDHVNKQEPVPLEIEAVNKEMFKGGYPKTFILTSWELRVAPDEAFIKCLEQIAVYYEAELLLVPCQKSDIRYIPEVLKEKFTIVTEDLEFNSNLRFKYIETNALVQSPLAGHNGAYDTTTIIPGLIKELRSESSQHYVKQLMSTGSVGYLKASEDIYNVDEDDKEFTRKWRGIVNRKYGKPTAIAENYVVPSALIIDVLDDDIFLSRFVSSHTRGVVYDLNLKFTPANAETYEPSALYCGDFHAWQINDVAYEATKNMIEYFQPKEVVIGDFFDGISINHHEFHDAVKMNAVPSLQEEANASIELLKELSEIANEVIYLQSNHDNFLTTWLNSPSQLWRINRNYELACKLQYHRSQTDKHPIVNLLELDSFDNVTFVSEKDNYYIGKVLLKHGHEGASGARVGFNSLAKIYNRYIQGHVHSPAVFRNAVCVGVLGELDMGYNIGASGWLSANALIHKDNSMQLLPIIHGNWIR